MKRFSYISDGDEKSSSDLMERTSEGTYDSNNNSSSSAKPPDGLFGG
jgi:hypothetical protein